ncbi:hypothetical protein [Blastococcus sp. SYSU DS1024]
MAKRAMAWAVGVTLLAFGLPALLQVGREGSGDVLLPPAGELGILALSVVLVLGLTFLIAYGVQRWNRRRAGQTRVNR